MFMNLPSPKKAISERVLSNVSSMCHRHISSSITEYAILGENWNVIWKYFTWNNLEEIILS